MRLTDGVISAPPLSGAAVWEWTKAEGFWSFVLPLVLFYGTRGRLGAGGALVLASLAPLPALALGLARERRIRPVPLLAGSSALLSGVVAWAFGDARAIVYKDAVMDALWGIAFILIALLPAARPLHRLAAPVAPWLRRGATPEDWDAPAVRACIPRLLLLWSALSFVFAASKPLCLWRFGLEGYLPVTIAIRLTLQTLATLYGLWSLRRALGRSD